MKSPTHRELEALFEAVVTAAHPLSIEELSDLLRPPLPRRTLQRRLQELVKQGRIEMVGRRTGTRYRAPMRLELPAPQDSAKDLSSEVYVPTTAAGDAVRAYVRQPSTERKPVAYNRAFLDAYVPQKTPYLAASAREELTRLGSLAAERAPAGTYARRVLQRLLIDLSWNSSRLEGNTYSLLDTERLIARGEIADEKDAFETQMLLNHKTAIEFLVDEADFIDVDRRTLLNLHAMLADNLLSDPAAGGRLRHIGVGIGGSVYRPLEVPQQVEECFGQVLHTAQAITDPLEQAFFLMVHLPYLQPFEDVNKRVSRLAANIPLIKHNLCPLSFVDVPKIAYTEGTLGVYELNKIDLLANTA